MQLPTISRIHKAQYLYGPVLPQTASQLETLDQLKPDSSTVDLLETKSFNAM